MQFASRGPNSRICRVEALQHCAKSVSCNLATRQQHKQIAWGKVRRRMSPSSYPSLNHQVSPNTSTMTSMSHPTPPLSTALQVEKGKADPLSCTCDPRAHTHCNMTYIHAQATSTSTRKHMLHVVSCSCIACPCSCSCACC